MRISDWSSDVCSSDLFLEHGANQVEHGSFACLVGHNLTVVEIHHRRQVQLLAVDVELSHIGYPFLARTHRVELTIQQVRCHAPDLTTIGSIFLQAHQRPQAYGSET